MLSRTRSSGFTLMEVMVVVVIVGVLMAIALPMYQDSTRKSRRSEAKRELMELASRQERFYAQNSEYSTDIAGELGLNLQRLETENEMYDLSVTPCTDAGGPIGFDRCYTLIARPKAGTDQDKDVCGELSVNGFGVRDSEGDDEDNCW